MNERKTVELAMKELLIVLLRKWWSILICAILVAGVFGIKTYTNLYVNRDELYRRYQVILDAYNQEVRTKEDAIQYFVNKKAAGEQYNSNSILMQIDPFNMNVAHMTIIVNAQGQEGEAGSAANLDSINSTIVGAYTSIVDSVPLASLLSGIISTDYQETYLKELVTIEETDAAKKNLLVLTAVGNEAIDPAGVLNVLFNYLEKQQESVARYTTPHQLVSLGSYASIESDPELAKVQSDRREALAEDSINIKKLEEALDKIRGSKPAVPSLFRGSMKSAAIAFLITMIIIAFGIIIDYIVHIRIQTDEQLQSQLGIRYLKGGLYKKGRLFGKWGDKLSGVERLASENEIKALVYANIRESVCGKYDIVLVTGTVDQDVIDGFANELIQLCVEHGTQFLASRDVANNASAIDALFQAQAVVFVERIGESQLKKVYHGIERVRQSNKDIIGYTLR